MASAPSSRMPLKPSMERIESSVFPWWTPPGSEASTSRPPSPWSSTRGSANSRNEMADRPGDCLSGDPAYQASGIVKILDDRATACPMDLVCFVWTSVARIVIPPPGDRCAGQRAGRSPRHPKRVEGVSGVSCRKTSIDGRSKADRSFPTGTRRGSA